MAGNNELAAAQQRKVEAALGTEQRLAPVALKLQQFDKKREANDYNYILDATKDDPMGGPAQNLMELRDKYKPSEKALKFVDTWRNLTPAQRAQYFNENPQMRAARVALDSGLWATNDTSTRGTAVKQAQGVLGKQDINFGDALTNNPEIALAAAMALNDGKIDDNKLQIINEATGMFNTLSIMATAQSDAVREKTWNNLSRPQQNAVISLADAILKDYKVKEAKGENPIIAFLGTTIGGIFNALVWANDQAQHVYRTAALTTFDNNYRTIPGRENFSDVANPFNFFNNPANIIRAWQDTETGKIDEASFQRLKEKYGDKNTTVVRDAIQLMGTEDGFGKLVKMYENDQEALQIIDQILLESERTPTINSLLKDTDSITRDDLGNIIANQTGLDPNNPVWQVIDKGVNFTAVFFGDPTLIAGKAVKAYKIFKYGLIRNTGIAETRNLLANPKVARMFDGLSNDIIRMNDAVDAREVNKIRQQIRTAYGKYVTDDAIDSLQRYFKETENRFPTRFQTIEGWINEGDGISQLLMGKPVRASQFTIPRMTKARELYIKARLGDKSVIKFSGESDKLIASILGDTNDPTVIRLAFGLNPTDDISKVMENPEFRNLMQQYQVSNLIDALLNPAIRAEISRLNGVDPATLVINEVKDVNTGKRLYRGWSTLSPAAWRARTDRWLRTFETAPSGRQIDFVTAKDTGQIYAWARTTFSREFSNQIAEIWRVANPGQRRIIAAGVFETIADARGITNPLLRNRVVTSSLRAGEEYAATQGVLRKTEDGRTVAVRYNPAEVSGRKHALHVGQLSEKLTVPNYTELQQISVKLGLLDKILGRTYGNTWTAVTNGWSFLNLAGPRYVERAAIEDHAGYILTGGSFTEYVSGKRVTQSFRESRGKTTGVVGEVSRYVGDGTNYVTRFVGKLFKGHLDKAEVAEAQKALERGSYRKFSELAVLSLSRMKLSSYILKTFNRKLSKVEDEALKAFASMGNEGLVLVDEVAEIGHDLNNFAVTNARLNLNAGRKGINTPGSRSIREENWTELTFQRDDTAAYAYWTNGMHWVLHTDGTIGQHVFNALLKSRTVEEAKKIAMPLIIKDIESGKFDVRMFSIFDEPNMTATDFASRYFDDSAHMFAMADGQLVNRRLVESLKTTDKDGNTVGKIYQRDASGDIVNELDPAFLRDDLTELERPAYVLGRRDKLVGFKGIKSFTEEAWLTMSESLARISREPIFFARYVGEYQALKPLVQRYVSGGMSEFAAKKLVRDMAVRRAEYVSLAYMDNPAVRSFGAMNARNVARYYRATEDFYRRAVRLAKYYPEGLQKASLTYGMLEDTGYVWKDDNGDQYFIYPGTGLLHQFVSRTMSVFQDWKPLTDSPFIYGGQPTMLTPSADPSSWLPTFASPIMGINIKLLTNIGPFKDLEQYLLGTRGAKVAGNPQEFSSELWSSILPGHATRILGIMNADERQSQYANAVRGAIQILAHNGQLDAKNLVTKADENAMMDRISSTAYAVLVVKTILGFTAPASPQSIANDLVSSDARKLGIKSLRQGYIQLLNQYEGDAEKALATWYKLNPDLLPFAVSQTEATTPIAPSSTTDAVNWFNDNSTFAQKHIDAMVYLAPRSGDFSYKMYGLMKSYGFIRNKTVDDMFKEVITKRDEFEYDQTKADYEDALANAKSPSEKASIEAKWKQLKQEFYASNPYLEDRIILRGSKKTTPVRERILKDVRAAIEEIYSSNTKLITDSTNRISSMVKTYDDAMTELSIYTGKTDSYSTSKRGDIRNTLKAILKDIAGDDTNAKNFYNMLDSLIGD